MLVGSGLWRRREGAFWTALALLIAGAVFSLTKGLEYEEALLLLGVAAILWLARKAFDRPSRLFQGSISTAWLTATIAAVTSMAVLGFLAFRNVVYTDELWWTFVRDGDASRFLRAGLVVAILTFAVAVMTLFSSPSHRRARASKADLEEARAILESSADAPATAWIAMTGDKDLLFSESRKSYLAYRVRANRWIALGAPIGEEAERENLMWRFVEDADKAGGTAVFYSASAALLPALAGMGFIIRQIGEAAVVDTKAFSLTGKSKQNLRTACNKAAAEGCTFEVLPPGSAMPLAGELKAVSEAWLNNHASAEKGFTMGRFDVAYLDLNPLAVVWKNGHIVAFANVMRGSQIAGIDLMRYSGDAPTAVMDFLFVRLIEWAREQDYPHFNLGMAPLSGLENRRLAPVFARIGALVFAEAGRLYSFGGLHAYKAKFGPEWRPMYMAGRPGVIMPLALLDVALLTGGGWSGLFLK
jgi:phosphatidylglycerol lysyltransferase